MKIKRQFFFCLEPLDSMHRAAYSCRFIHIFDNICWSRSMVKRSLYSLQKKGVIERNMSLLKLVLFCLFFCGFIENWFACSFVLLIYRSPSPVFLMHTKYFFMLEWFFLDKRVLIKKEVMKFVFEVWGDCRKCVVRGLDSGVCVRMFGSTLYVVFFCVCGKCVVKFEVFGKSVDFV